MNMYLYELKANRRYVLTWLIVIIGIVFFLGSFYSTFHSDMADFVKIINNMPETLRSALGMNPDTIGSILGYYAFILTFVFLCCAIEAMMLGLSILSKEIRERAADFLLSKPVSRIQIVSAKLLSSLTLIIASNIIWFVSFYLILLSFSDAPFAFKTYVMLTFTIIFLQIIFLALGFIMAVIIPKVKAVIPITLGTVFGFYLLSTLTDSTLRVFMPFKYFDIAQILVSTSYEAKYILISILITVVSISLTYIIYKKKDIQAV